MKTAVTRLTIFCIGLIVISLIFTFQSVAKVDLKNALAIWLFDEGKGDEVKDFTGKGNDGKLMNGPKWVDGKFGKALSFDGVNQYVEINNPVNIPGTSHSISVLVNPGKTQRQYADMLGNHMGTFQGYDIEQRSNETNKYYTGMAIGGAWAGGTPDARPATQLTEGVWQHFVGVRQGTTITHYLNGEKTLSYEILKDPNRVASVPPDR